MTGTRRRSLALFDMLVHTDHDPASDFMPLLQQVRQEVARVTWPTRKETLITTGLVLALSALAALFFMLVDWIIAGAMRLLFGLGV